MSRVRFWVAAGLIGGACLFAPAVRSQSGANRAGQSPKLQPVADTKLIMEGLAGANLRGLGKLLREKPAEAEAWAFARGQALLLAETGNLLLIRPPRSGGEDTWTGHALDLRDAAAKLARAAAVKDYPASRAALAGVANVCNRCHGSFRVAARVDPFAGE
jgi:hypothetical protein